MRVVIAPDKFKGTLTAREAAAAMAEGVRRVWPDAEIDLCPMSDGGEGFVDVLCEALGGKKLTRSVCGPLPGMRAEAEIGLLPGGTAVIEMSAAAGLALLRGDQRNPLETTTFGVGELIRFAIGMDCRHIVLGLGGSATIDAGIGCLQALGCPIELADGTTVTADDPPLCGKHLGDVVAVGRPGLADDLVLDVACDVKNPLFGPNGAAHVYGPQKGATPEQVDRLDTGLRHLADRLPGDPQAPGMGAAGGIGYGLAAMFDTELVPGVEIVGHAVLLPHLDDADFVLTGEGRYDETSLNGKVVGYVETVAHTFADAPGLIVCGRRDRRAPTGIFEMVVLTDRVSEAEAMADPARHIADAVAESLRSRA